MDVVLKLVERNGLVFAFLFTGLLIMVSQLLSRHLTRGRVPWAAIAISAGLTLAAFGGKKGVADIPFFSGMALLGGSMLRDFSITATAMGASISEIRKAGIAGTVALLLGVLVAFAAGVLTGWAFGYSDAKSLATIGAGALTFIVGPVTGSAVGASSEVIAISIATGVIKTIVVTIGTPLLARRIGLDNPQSAMVYGGLIGTTSGVAAGLAATDARLVPYGALTATFYTGLGCLLCPSLLYGLLRLFFP